ncbi:HYDIN protein, partial [Orthonyx spaldingii]|nr:HYDIN protein [Orthonyx spaldingii]
PEKKETKSPEKHKTKSPEKKKTKSPEKGEAKAPEKGKTKAPEKGEAKAPEKGKTKAPEKGEAKAPEKGEAKVPKKGETKVLKKGETKVPKKGEATIPKDPDEMEKNLMLRFEIYESSQQSVAQVYSYWDRVQGTVQLPVTKKEDKSQPPAKNKGQKMTSTPQEKVEKPVEKHEGHRSLKSSQLETQSGVAEGAVRNKRIGVPCLDIPVTDPSNMIKKILEKLPTEEQMLKHLGLPPEGPPIPPAAVFSVVDYPEKRSGPAECMEPFTIAKTPDEKGSSATGQPKTEKAASKDESPEKNQISPESTKSPQDPSTTRSKSSSEAEKSTLQRASAPKEPFRLKRYRWIVPAHGEVELKVCFCTTKPGKFERTLRFELLGTKRLYEVPCSGTG